MMYTIQTKVLKKQNSDVIQLFSSNYKSEVNLTIGQLKELIKTRLTTVSDDIIDSEFIHHNGVLKSDDSEILPPSNGIKYSVVLK